MKYLPYIPPSLCLPHPDVARGHRLHFIFGIWSNQERESKNGRVLIIPTNPQKLPSSPYLSPFDLRFCIFFPLGRLSLPIQNTPPGPVTQIDSRPLEDFKVNSTASPSFRLRKSSMCSLLWCTKASTAGSDMIPAQAVMDRKPNPMRRLDHLQMPAPQRWLLPAAAAPPPRGPRPPAPPPVPWRSHLSFMWLRGASAT